MKKFIFLFFTLPIVLKAQQSLVFPQREINRVLGNGHEAAVTQQSFTKSKTGSAASQGVKQFLDKFTPSDAAKTLPPSKVNSSDTLIVGLVPNDTVVITGPYLQKGPIWVINDGVLIIHNATATILGDIDATGSGKIFADSSSLFFPQQYFYQRGIVSSGSSDLRFTDCGFNYGGMSHNLAILDSAKVIFTRVHQADWTTAGTFGKPTFIINGTNLAGEVIINGDGLLHFSHADSLLPWYQMPPGSVINTTFPNGDSVGHYVFDKSISGIAGVNYSAVIDTCNIVWWGMMPVNGSDVTISNSKIRAIGMWFVGADTVAVSGLVDNSTYSNFTAQLADRNLQLINSSLMTWSLYPMDSSHIDISGCIVGEIGAGGKSTAIASKIFVDGSGGYFWSSGTGVGFAVQTAFTCNVRSEQNGIVLAGYCNVSQGVIAGIGNSLLFAVQTSSSQPPVALDGSVVWDAYMAGPTTAYADSVVHLMGSAWIDRGPTCVNPMDFGNYQMFWQPSGATTWQPLTPVVTTEVHENELALWNTHGLAAGNYNLMLVLKDSSGDSVNANTSITLLASILSVNELALDDVISYPNPVNQRLLIQGLKSTDKTCFELFDYLGRKIDISARLRDSNTSAIELDASNLTDGIYMLKINDEKEMVIRKIVVKH